MTIAPRNIADRGIEPRDNCMTQKWLTACWTSSVPARSSQFGSEPRLTYTNNGSGSASSADSQCFQMVRLELAVRRWMVLRLTQLTAIALG